MKVVKFFKKYPLALALLYTVFHFVVFFSLEKVIEPEFIIHCAIDDYIPFCEYFIVPYLLWFLYVPVSTVLLIRQDVSSYWKLAIMLFGGNLICLILYVIFPNGVMPKESVEETNIFSSMVNILYDNDTPTNVCPSMHTLDTLAVHCALVRSQILKNRRWIKLMSFTFLISICIATVVLKQHSIIDVFAAFVLFGILERIAYSKKKSLSL